MNYRIFPAIRRGFRPSRMTSNNLISPMKFCYKTNSTLPKQCQSSRSILEDGSRTFGLFWKEKTPSYNRRNTVSPICTCCWRADHEILIIIIIIIIKPLFSEDYILSTSLSNIWSSTIKKKVKACTVYTVCTENNTFYSFAV